MVGASVPETPVHKNSYLCAGEDNIRPRSSELREAHIYAISESSTVEFPSDGEFGAGVLVPNTPHLIRLCSRRRNQL